MSQNGDNQNGDNHNKGQKYLNTLAALTHATRALSGHKDLDIVFDGEQGSQHEGGEISRKPQINLPALPQTSDEDTLMALQALANRQAFLIRYSKDADENASPYYTQAFKKGPAAEAIAPLENAWTEARGKADYAGSAAGLDELREEEAKALLAASTESNEAWYKGRVLATALREALGENLSNAEKDVLKQNKTLLSADIKKWLASAAKHLQNPHERPRLYKDLIDMLGFQEEEEDPPPQSDDGASEGDDSQEEETGDSSAGEEKTEQETGAEESEGEQQESNSQSEDDRDAREHEGQHAKQGGRPEAGTGKTPYHIFTTAHDLTTPAEKLLSDPELARLRARYKKVTLGTQATVSQMAIKLQRLLLAQTSLGWRFDQEEGLLDPKKLPQIIATGDPYPFRRPRVRPERDTVVTLLLDNSGSMRGRPIEMAATSADVLTRTLERCGVKTEVLGFTTQTWKGGQSRLDWISAGSPDNPGRLNDSLHLIYKDADKSYQASRPAFAAMLADDLLKENIDGESLLWAYGRLLNRPEKRKILIVISDGAPVDYATDKHNVPNFLDGHLRKVVGQIEKQSKVELLAIGIGHDVRRYYRHAVTIQNPADLSSALVERMVYLFSHHDRTPKKLSSR